MPLFKRIRTSINAQILLIVLVVSSFATLLITVFQLYFDYRQEVEGIEKNFTLIERTYKEGLESAVWNYDFKLLEVCNEISIPSSFITKIAFGFTP